MQCHSNLTMRKMCSPILASWIRWHAFSYIFLDGEGTTRKRERRKWLTPHQKISLSRAFNMGTMFKMQVTSLLKQPIFFLKWQTSYLKLNGTQLFQVLVPSPSYLFTVLGEKKNREESLATHTVDGLISTGFLRLIMGKSISIHGGTLQEALVLPSFLISMC